MEKGAWAQALGCGTEPTRHCQAQGMRLGWGWRAVLAARQASVLPVGQGMASGVAFGQPSKGGMRKGRTALAPCELPTTFAMAPAPANCWPDTARLCGSFTVQHGSWGRAPGWVPDTLGYPWSLVCLDINSTGTRQEPYQEVQVALSVLAQGHILAEPWSHSTSSMHG